MLLRGENRLFWWSSIRKMTYKMLFDFDGFRKCERRQLLRDLVLTEHDVRLPKNPIVTDGQTSESGKIHSVWTDRQPARHR